MLEKALLNKVLQVAVVVKDLMKSVKTYNDDYGIGPWQFMNLILKQVKKYE